MFASEFVLLAVPIPLMLRACFKEVGHTSTSTVHVKYCFVSQQLQILRRCETLK